SDFQQVLIYLFALPLVARSMPRLLEGEVVYGNGDGVTVQAHEITQAWIDRLGELMGRIIAFRPPKPVPSVRECGFCDVPASLCPARVEGEDPKGMVGTTSAF